MPKAYEYLKPAGAGNPAFSWVDDLLNGTPGEQGQRSKLRPSQEPLAEQAIKAGLQKGAGGAYGDAADYYRSNLSDNPADFNAFAAPEIRNFNEDIIPGLSEQFAGMGAGGLSSSGFRNAAVNAGTDLSERLGAIRANLRSQSAQGLQGIGQAGLQSFDENYVEPPTEGLLNTIAPAAVSAATAYFTGGASVPFDALKGTKFQGATSNYAGQRPVSNKGSSNPYRSVGVTGNMPRPGIG